MEVWNDQIIQNYKAFTFFPPIWWIQIGGTQLLKSWGRTWRTHAGFLPPGHEAQHPNLVGSYCLWSARTMSSSLLLWLLLQDEQKSFCHVLLTRWHTMFKWEGSFTFLIPHPHPGMGPIHLPAPHFCSQDLGGGTQGFQCFLEDLSFAPNVWSPV